jgi:hypothetical protein
MNYLRNSDQPLSDAQVIVILLGIDIEGTYYISSKYTMINLYTFIGYTRESNIDIRVSIGNRYLYSLDPDDENDDYEMDEESVNEGGIINME